MAELNSTPSANRLHIAFFGCRNVGKSSLANAVTGQDLAVVSDIRGTTTDPVSKAMELLPLGPVVIIDTPGIDDEGYLGEKRVLKTKQILNRTDIAVLVTESARALNRFEKAMLDIFRAKAIPFLIVANKCDLGNALSGEPDVLPVSAKTGMNIKELKDRIAGIIPKPAEKPIVADLIPSGSTVILVIPIDASAPKGRLILPQQQVLRELLEAGDIAVTVKETELSDALQRLSVPPAAVITDSQVFPYVSEIVPDEIPLTSFSILMARYKGYLDTALSGIAALDRLQDGDTVLIAEGCTHHRQCNDIGTVKIPGWLHTHCNRNIHIRTCSGTEFPEDLSPYSVIIHCGGCMLTEREVQYRMRCALDQNVPFINYGTLIAYTNGILTRSIRLLKGNLQ